MTLVIATLFSLIKIMLTIPVVTIIRTALHFARKSKSKSALHDLEMTGNGKIVTTGREYLHVFPTNKGWMLMIYDNNKDLLQKALYETEDEARSIANQAYRLLKKATAQSQTAQQPA